MKYRFLKRASFIALATLGFIHQAQSMPDGNHLNTESPPEIKKSDPPLRGRIVDGFQRLERLFGDPKGEMREGQRWQAGGTSNDREPKTTKALEEKAAKIKYIRDIAIRKANQLTDKIIKIRDIAKLALLNENDSANLSNDETLEKILEYQNYAKNFKDLIKKESNTMYFDSALDHVLSNFEDSTREKNSIEGFLEIMQGQAEALYTLYDMAIYLYTSGVNEADDYFESYFKSEFKNKNIEKEPYPVQEIWTLDNLKAAVRNYAKRA
jgi:hypothetical protein